MRIKMMRMSELPEELIKKLRQEKENECEEGRKAAIEFAKNADYWLIEKTREELYEDEFKIDDVTEALQGVNFFIQSSVWK